MRSLPLELGKSWQASPTDPGSRTGVHGLVRRLIRQLGSAAPAADLTASGSGGEVMLEVQVEGVRWLLVRVPPQPVRPSLILSPREREIARMVSRGYPNKTIARVLEISSWTV